MASKMAPIDLPDPPVEPQEGPKNAPRELQESPERAKPMKTLTKINVARRGGDMRQEEARPKITTDGVRRKICCFGMGWWGCAKREQLGKLHNWTRRNNLL